MSWTVADPCAHGDWWGPVQSPACMQISLPRVLPALVNANPASTASHKQGLGHVDSTERGMHGLSRFCCCCVQLVFRDNELSFQCDTVVDVFLCLKWCTKKKKKWDYSQIQELRTCMGWTYFPQPLLLSSSFSLQLYLFLCHTFLFFSFLGISSLFLLSLLSFVVVFLVRWSVPPFTPFHPIASDSCAFCLQNGGQ